MGIADLLGNDAVVAGGNIHMPAVPDHLILQIQPGLVIAAIIVVAVGNGMSGLRGIAAKRVKGAAPAGPQVVTEAMIFGAEDQGVRGSPVLKSARRRLSVDQPSSEPREPL